MSVEKLKEFRNFEKKYGRLAVIFAVPAVLAFFSFFLYNIISGNALKLSTAVTVAIIIVVFLILACIFGFKEMNYVSEEEACIISMLEGFIESEGIAKENFELIYNEAEHKYLIAFHNQNINYDDLGVKVNVLLHELNKIVNKNIRARLL